MIGPMIDNHQSHAEESYLSEFCEKIGMRYFFEAGCLWQSMGLRLFVPTPNCFAVDLTPQTLESMWSEGAFFVQRIVPEFQKGFASYAFIVDDRNYDLDSIKSSDRRHNIRRAFKHCVVERVSFDSIKREALTLISDTYARQGRGCGDSVLKGWTEYIDAAASNPLFSVWATFVGKELAALKIEYRYRGGVHPEALFSRSDLLRYYTMNALLFVSTRETIRMNGVSYISHGMRPVTGEKQTLVDFKESMGFRKMIVNERLEINPRLKIINNSVFHHVGKFIPQTFAERSEYLRVIQGILETLKMQHGA